MMRKTGLFFLFISISFSPFSQTFFEIEWERTHDISLSDKIYSIIQSPNGYLISGITDPMTGEGSKILVSEVSEQGDLIWKQSVGEGNYLFKDASITSGDGYILLAGSEGESNNIQLFRVDHAGQLEWSSYLGTDEKDVAYRILRSADGGYVVCGAKEIQGDHDTDGWLVKLNKKGKMDWQGLYGERYINEELRTITANPLGGYLLGGLTHADLRKPVVPFVIKVDDRGKTIWEKTFSEMENMIAQHIYLDSDGFIIVIAEAFSDGSKFTDEFRVLKLNQAGLLIAEYSIPGYEGCFFPHYYVEDDHLFLIFDILDNQEEYSGSAVMKTDRNFKPVWIKHLSKSDPHIKSIISTGDNSYMAVGWKTSGESYRSDINLIVFTDHSDRLVNEYVNEEQGKWNVQRENESETDYESRMRMDQDEMIEELTLEARVHFGMLEAPAKPSSARQERPAGDTPQLVFRSGKSNEESILMGTYYGLLIAVNDYDDQNITDLDQPVRDAEKLYDVLINEYLFEKVNVTLLKNPTREEIINALDRLEATITKEDNLLIFYAGHGYWDEKTQKGYWLPSDANQFSTANWIRNTSISGYIKGINSKHTLLIADACFSGSIFKTRSAFGSANMAISRLNQLPSRKAMTSGTLKEVPDQSVFVEYLIKRLYENEDQYLPSEQLFFSFKPAVLNNSDNIPQFGEIKDAGDEGGDFIFMRK